jgi:hypothetical protein
MSKRPSSPAEEDQKSTKKQQLDVDEDAPTQQISSSSQDDEEEYVLIIVVWGSDMVQTLVPSSCIPSECFRLLHDTQRNRRLTGTDRRVYKRQWNTIVHLCGWDDWVDEAEVLGDRWITQGLLMDPNEEDELDTHEMNVLTKKVTGVFCFPKEE